MKWFVLRRLLLMIPAALGVLTLVFFLVHLVPGDPVDLMLGESAGVADRESLRHALGLDQSLPRQYEHFLGGLFRGDLGESFFYREPVARVIAERYPATVELAALALIMALLIALPVGILAASRPYTLWDNGAMFFSLLGVSLPNFWLGPLLILVFALKLSWFPVSGREGFTSVILPALTLGAGMAGILSRMIRGSLLEVMGEEYITAARSRGLSEAAVWLRHALKNSLIPVVSVVGLQFGALLSGAIITDTIFSWPGVGQLLLSDISSRDYPLLQGCILVIAFTYLGVGLLADLLYAWVDPRIHYGRAS
ncbi:MAG: ABC transporter permease [Proteobacteria bacterium]|nr:ABC transporter permease [Pseudomonadota bacterium]